MEGLESWHPAQMAHAPGRPGLLVNEDANWNVAPEPDQGRQEWALAPGASADGDVAPEAAADGDVAAEAAADGDVAPEEAAADGDVAPEAAKGGEQAPESEHPSSQGDHDFSEVSAGDGRNIVRGSSAPVAPARETSWGSLTGHRKGGGKGGRKGGPGEAPAAREHDSPAKSEDDRPASALARLQEINDEKYMALAIEHVECARRHIDDNWENLKNTYDLDDWLPSLVALGADRGVVQGICMLAQQGVSGRAQANWLLYKWSHPGGISPWTTSAGLV